MSNTAQNKLIPQPGILRATFLYVGQGEAILLTIPEGGNFRYALIDTNNDQENGGIDVCKLLNDLLESNDDLTFINTHPHKDHLKGIKNIHENVTIKEVWHSGHRPGKNHDDAYKEMRDVIEDIGSENEFVLFGTNDKNKIRESGGETEKEKKLGDIDYEILSPAEYVQDEVDDSKADERYNRIHERSAVMIFSYGGDSKTNIMITGDSDKKAWQEHITEYHKDKLTSKILSASHHGSRTFFKDSEEDEEPYEEHIKNISPKEIIISAPNQSESPHDHPHDDALNLYKEYVNENNIYHLGENRECVIVDIDSNGNKEIKWDHDLVEEYKFDTNGDKNNDNNESSVIFPGSRTSRIDDQPMGVI